MTRRNIKPHTGILRGIRDCLADSDRREVPLSLISSMEDMCPLSMYFSIKTRYSSGGLNPQKVYKLCQLCANTPFLQGGFKGQTSWPSTPEDFLQRVQNTLLQSENDTLRYTILLEKYLGDPNQEAPSAQLVGLFKSFTLEDIRTHFKAFFNVNGRMRSLETVQKFVKLCETREDLRDLISQHQKPTSIRTINWIMHGSANGALPPLKMEVVK